MYHCFIAQIINHCVKKKKRPGNYAQFKLEFWSRISSKGLKRYIISSAAFYSKLRVYVELIIIKVLSVSLFYDPSIHNYFHDSTKLKWTPIQCLIHVCMCRATGSSERPTLFYFDFVIINNLPFHIDIQVDRRADR